MSALPWGLIALAYHLASRLAYVLYIGLALRRQERSSYLTLRRGPEGGFRRFRGLAATLMYNDAASFVLLCLATWGTLSSGLPRGAVLAVGTLLVIIGTSVKLWAAATLGGGPYYWRDFFLARWGEGPCTAGPFRYLKNPMYTVGDLQTHGFALVTGALPGRLAAGVDPPPIFTVFRLVEEARF